MPTQGFRHFRAARAGLIALSTVLALAGSGALAAPAPGAPEKAPKPPPANQAQSSGPVPNCTAAWSPPRRQCVLVGGTCPQGRLPAMHPVPVGNPTHCTCQCH